MSDGPEGVRVSDILIGTFLILSGLCFTLAGGACTLLWVATIFPIDSYGPQSGDLVMLAVSIAAAAFGIFGIYHGIRIARGRYRNG